MEALSGRDIALTGIPRGGTTLACRLLGMAADTVALSEPMDVATLPAHRAGALAEVADFFRRTRCGLQRDGVAPSKLEGDRVPDNPFAAPGADGERRIVVARGQLRVDPPPAPGFTLVVKHNAAFIALLPELRTGREVLAVVRNPLAVLASWDSLRLPVSGGRLPAGERLDAALSHALRDEPDRRTRQLRILQWCFDRFAGALPATQVLRYEDIIASQAERLYAAAGVRGQADATLHGRNASDTYRDFPAREAAGRLATSGGAWSQWYADDEIAALAGRLDGGRHP